MDYGPGLLCPISIGAGTEKAKVKRCGVPLYGLISPGAVTDESVVVRYLCSGCEIPLQIKMSND